MATLLFKPKSVTKKLLGAVKERSRDILSQRFGLDTPDNKRRTLEAIGESYGVTRERIRQIQDYSLDSIRKSDLFSAHRDVFNNLVSEIESRGGLVHENDFLSSFDGNQTVPNHVHFLLVLGDPFYRNKETTAFRHRWYIERKISDAVETALSSIFESLDEDDLISEEDIIGRLKTELSQLENKYQDESILRRWLRISKNIDKNVLNIGIDYGGRDEVVRAIKKLNESKVDVVNLDIDEFSKYLDTSNQLNPFPDIVIRTGKEARLSGFMIWQAAYSEIFFLDKYLPDVTTKDIDIILGEYDKRQRRFGK